MTDAPPPSKRRRAKIIRLSDVVPMKVRWLWPGRIPLAKISIIEGDPDVGKSTVSLDIAARVSAGHPMPDGSHPFGDEPRGVVIVCAEDDLADTVVPRLIAAGADLSHMVTLGLARDDEGQLIPFTINRLSALRRAIREVDAVLVILDPITAFLPEGVDAHKDAETRRALMPLKELAERSGAALLFIRHLNKAGDLKAKYRGGGSIAFTAVARSVLVMDQHPNDPRSCVLANVKANLTVPQGSLGYMLVSHAEHDCALVVWLGEIDITADVLLGRKDARRNSPARREAARLIVMLLKETNGVRNAGEMRSLLTAAGCSPATVGRAREDLGVTTQETRAKDGTVTDWAWSLPADCDWVEEFVVEDSPDPSE
jgi:hypothetical protein